MILSVRSVIVFFVQPFHTEFNRAEPFQRAVYIECAFPPPLRNALIVANGRAASHHRLYGSIRNPHASLVHMRPSSACVPRPHASLVPLLVPVPFPASFKTFHYKEPINHSVISRRDEPCPNSIDFGNCVGWSASTLVLEQLPFVGQISMLCV